MKHIRRLFSAVLAASLATAPAWAGSLPSTASSNLTVINGSNTTTNVSGNTLTINTNGQSNVVLSWENFWDGTANGGTSVSGAEIDYLLPSSTSSILNSVVGGVATTINGELTSNGRIFLINPAGITVSNTGIINAAGFYASTYAEPLNYFEQNGTLAIFGNGLNGGSNSIAIQPGANITTISGSGNLELAAPAIDVSTTVTGNVYLYGEGGAVTLGANGATSVSGSVSAYNSLPGTTIALNGGAAAVTITGSATVSTTTATGVTLASGAGNLSVGGNLSVSSDGGTIATTAGAGNATVSGNVVLDASGSAANGSVTQTGGGLFSATGASATTLINTATEATAGSPTTGNPSTSPAPGTVTLNQADFSNLSVIGGATTVTDTTTHTLGLGTIDTVGNFSATAATLNGSGSSTVTGSYSLTSTGSGTLTLGSATVNGNYSATSGGNIATANAGAVAVTGTGHTISLTSTGTNNSITFNGSGAVTFSTLAVTGANAAVTLSSTGNIALNVAASTIPTLSVTSTGGSVSDAGAGGALTVTQATINAATTISLGQTHADAITSAVLQGGASGIALTDSAPLTLAGGTSATGNATITDTYGTAGTAIAFGATSGDSVTFGGNLTVAANGGAAENIVTNANALNITGSVSLSSGGGSIALGTANATGSYGQVSLSSPGATDTVIGVGTVNLGAVNAGTLAVTATGGITNTSGSVGVGGLTLTSGTTSTPGNIQIGTGNAGAAANAAITGTITINNAGNVTLVNDDPTVIVSGTSGAATNFGTLSATVGNTTTPASDALTVTFASTKGGGYSGLQFNLNGSTGNVSFGTSGNPDPIPVTISNATDASTSTFSLFAAGSITLGSGISLNSTGATSLTELATGGTIQDTASSPVFIFGPVTFTSAGGINVANNTANSLGPVAFIQTGATNTSNITYSEGGTVNLAGISIANTTSTESVSVTSTSGGIVQSVGTGITLGTNPALSGLTFSAPTGSIALTSATNAFGLSGTTATAVPVTLTSKGNLAVTDNANLLLGNVTDGGTFTLNTAGTAGQSISQAAGTSIWEFGAPTLTTQGGAITLNNTGNNFGAFVIDTTDAGAATAGANVTIQETSDDNYASLATGTAGNWTATSTASGITENAGATINVGGTTSLNAATVITLTSANNTFGGPNGVQLVSVGNTTVTDNHSAAGVGTVLLAGSAIGGNLVLTNSAGNISDNGTSARISVTGTTQLIATNGTVNMTGNNSSYVGSVLIKTGNTGTSSFTDNSNLNIEGGSVVNDPMTYTSGGNITTVGGFISTYASTLHLTADGSIVVSTPIDVTGQLTVDAVAGPTNLSQESLSNNLNNLTPINDGSATNYTGPSP